MFFHDFFLLGPSLPPPASPHRLRRPPLPPPIVPSSHVFCFAPYDIQGIFEELFASSIFPPEPFLEKPSGFLFFRRFSKREGFSKVGETSPATRDWPPLLRDTRRIVQPPPARGPTSTDPHTPLASRLCVGREYHTPALCPAFLSSATLALSLRW